MVSLWLGVALMAVAGLVRFSSLDALYERRRSDASRYLVLSSPGPALMKALSMQHALMGADLLWMDLVQSFGESMARTPDYPRIPGRVDMATDLDPNYFTIYQASAITLLSEPGAVDDVERILDKGEAHISSWYLRFLKGYLYYFIREDPGEAAKLWTEATLMEDAPFWLGGLAGRAKLHAEGGLAAEAMLEALIPNLSGRQKEEAEYRLLAIRSEVALRLYDDACKAFKAETGRLPTASELYDSGRVEVPPQDQFSGAITLDKDCVSRTKMIPLREFEVIERNRRVKPHE